MKNANLLNTTIIVAVVALASNFVNAEGQIKKTIEGNQNTVIKQTEFSGLIKLLDTDKDGLLSETEVLASSNKELNLAFKKVDSNKDKKIDKAEYNSYLAATKSKATTLVKNITK